MTRCWEVSDSFSGSVTNEGDGAEQEEITRRFVIGQVLDVADLRSRMELFAPRYATDPLRGTYWVRRRMDWRGLGNRYFDVAATYSTLFPKAGVGVAPSSIAWDTTGVTERIYQALEETVYPNTEPSFDRAIGVTGDSIEGIDVPRPGMRYSETWLFPTATAFSDEYLTTVHRLTGTVCDSAFRAFDEGECLFLGARCQWNGDTPFAQITFEFDAKPNVEEYEAGDLEPFAKEGWEYVWLRYKDAVDTNTLVKRVQAAYKNRVFVKEPWTDLRIIEDEDENPIRVGSAKTPELPSPTALGTEDELRRAFGGSFA